MPRLGHAPGQKNRSIGGGKGSGVSWLIREKAEVAVSENGGVLRGQDGKSTPKSRAERLGSWRPGTENEDFRVRVQAKVSPFKSVLSHFVARSWFRNSKVMQIGRVTVYMDFQAWSPDIVSENLLISFGLFEPRKICCGSANFYLRKKGR